MSELIKGTRLADRYTLERRLGRGGDGARPDEGAGDHRPEDDRSEPVHGATVAGPAPAGKAGRCVGAFILVGGELAKLEGSSVKRARRET